MKRNYLECTCAGAVGGFTPDHALAVNDSGSPGSVPRTTRTGTRSSLGYEYASPGPWKQKTRLDEIKEKKMTKNKLLARYPGLDQRSVEWHEKGDLFKILSSISEEFLDLATDIAYDTAIAYDLTDYDYEAVDNALSESMEYYNNQGTGLSDTQFSALVYLAHFEHEQAVDDREDEDDENDDYENEDYDEDY